jgi:hypothetical protein
MPRRKKQQHEYQGGRIKGLIEATAGFIARNPALATNLDLLHATLQFNIPGYGNREVCFNCGRNMQIAIVRMSPIIVLLLEAMAREVKRQTDQGVPFTQANRIHIDRLTIPTAIKKQQSNAGYLNLIKQPDGTRRSGYWVITNWGWAALRDEPFPDWAKVKDRRLHSRSETTTTFSRVRAAYAEDYGRKVERQRRFGKQVKQADFRGDLEGWEPVRWAEYAIEPEETT